MTQISKTTSKNAMYNVETNNITEINVQKLKTMSAEECKKEINEHNYDSDDTIHSDSDHNQQNKNDNCKQDIQIINIIYYNNNELSENLSDDLLEITAKKCSLII